MQFELKSGPAAPEARIESVSAHGRMAPVMFIHNPRAKRYILRLLRNGIARVTVPGCGTLEEARDFLHRHMGWLERQLLRPAPARARWQVGAEVYLRGELEVVAPAGPEHPDAIRLGGEVVKVGELAGPLRRQIETHLWRLALKELPPRVCELSELFRLPFSRLSIRNQKTRWGSCSPRGTISLNWRLIQMPPHVSDYIILHELCHRKHMNHSPRFWELVERVCPEFWISERWLKEHTRLLR